jgi:hypothetical protein
MGSRDKDLAEYGVVGMAQLADNVGVQIGEAGHQTLQQFPNGLRAVARDAIQLVTWLVESSDYRLDIVPVLGLDVTVDDLLTALPKPGSFHDADIKAPLAIRWDSASIHRKLMWKGWAGLIDP